MTWQNPTVQRIEQNCQLLYHGYDEKVDYVVEIAVHAKDCVWYGKTNRQRPCECEVVKEKRARNVRRPGLIQQLREYAANKDTDRKPKAERGAPRVKTAGRPPGDMAGFFAVDELECEITALVDRAMEDAGRDRTWASLPVQTVLEGLARQVSWFIDERPDLARDVDKAAAAWVAKARSTLRISTSEAIFDSVPCGNCGGSLGTPWGNVGEDDVRCIGSAETPPCGETYPMSEWMRLYESARR